MMNKKLVQCLQECVGNDCLQCDKIHEEDVSNCPCNRNCPGECNKMTNKV